MKTKKFSISKVTVKKLNQTEQSLINGGKMGMAIEAATDATDKDSSCCESDNDCITKGCPEKK